MSRLQILPMVLGHAVRCLPERAGCMLQIEICSTKQTNQKKEEKESFEQSRNKMISSEHI